MSDKTAFNPAGLCKTRAGLPVRIVCTDRRDRAFPFIALYEDGSGEGVLCITADGRCAELPEGVDEWPPEGNPNDVVNCTPDDPCNALRRRSSVQEAAPATAASGDVTALRWAMDEIDALSNRLTGFAYPQGMAMLGRADQLPCYEMAVAARAVAPAGVPEGVADRLRQMDEHLADGFVECPRCGWEVTTSDMDVRSDIAEMLSASPTPTAQGMGWQDIARAPKDGTRIDVWLGADEFPMRRTDVYWGRPHHECGEAGSYCDSCPPDRDMWCDDLSYGEAEDLQPTHWMPLPSAPASTSAGEA